MATGTRSRSKPSRRSGRKAGDLGDLGDRIIDRLPRPASAVIGRLRHEDVFLLAAGLAFYALVSIAPFAMLVLWLVSLVAGDDQVRQVADEMARLLPPKLRVAEALQRVAELGAGLGVGALLALLWPATAYGAGLSRAFDRLCPAEDHPAKGLRGRALALALVGVMPALVLAGLVASYVGTALFRHGVLATVVGWALALIFGFVGSAATTAAIYRLFAPRPVSTPGLLRGAATAGAAIALLSAGYALFLHVGADFEHRYATSGLAAIVLLAVWLFLANALILVGYQMAQES
ncbi:MAG: YihY/virulence factor BrkB family protein [Acidimicrobiales bacterium]